MTEHSYERAKERANLNRRSAEKMMRNALEFGLKPSELPAKERSYLESKENKQTIVRYYSHFCFIFTAEGSCITMYRVPKWFLKKSNYDGKKSIRNPKKYFTRYSYDSVLVC